jgi:hypothetical protein
VSKWPIQFLEIVVCVAISILIEKNILKAVNFRSYCSLRQTCAPINLQVRVNTNAKATAPKKEKSPHNVQTSYPWSYLVNF